MKIVAHQPTQAQTNAQSAEKSRGRSIIEALRDGKGGIEKRLVDGKEVFIKRLDWPEITRVRLAIPRDKVGVLNLQDEDHLRAVTIAMIATAVVEGFAEGEECTDEEGNDKAPTNDTPVFTNAEAVELVDMPEAMLYVGQLFNEVCVVNPNVLPNSNAAPSNQ